VFTRVCRVYLQVEDDVSCISGGTVKREGNHRRCPAPRCGKHGSAIFKHPARCIRRHRAASTSSPKYLIASNSREKIRDLRPVWLPRRRRHRSCRETGIRVHGNFWVQISTTVQEKGSRVSESHSGRSKCESGLSIFSPATRGIRLLRTGFRVHLSPIVNADNAIEIPIEVLADRTSTF